MRIRFFLDALEDGERMEQEQKALTAFVRLHGSRLKGTSSNDRVAHLVEYSSAGVPLDIPLSPYSVEDVVGRFDTESHPVRWLIKQMQTYEPSSSAVLGLIFNEKTVLAHVIQCGSPKTDADDDDA